MQSLHRHPYVDSCRADSDHFPLCLGLAGCESAPPEVVGPGGKVHRSRKRLKWNTHCPGAYQAELVGKSCMSKMQSVMHSLDAREETAIAQYLNEKLLHAARAASMIMSKACCGAKCAVSLQKPWFDHDCKQLKAVAKAIRAAGAGIRSSELREACAAFKKVARCKQLLRKHRMFRQQRMQLPIDMPVVKQFSPATNLQLPHLLRLPDVIVGANLAMSPQACACCFTPV